MQLGWYLGRWSHGGRAGRGWPLPGTELVATAVPAACYSFSRREPLDCGSFEAQGRQGQRQSPGYVCLASLSKVTAGLGTPVGECTAKGLCRVGVCEHRACRALPLSQQGPRCSAIPSWCEGAPSAWQCRGGESRRAHPGSLQAVSIPAQTPQQCTTPCPQECTHTATAATPALCWQQEGTVGTAAACRPPLPPAGTSFLSWQLPIKPISWMTSAMQEPEAL